MFHLVFPSCYFHYLLRLFGLGFFLSLFCKADFPQYLPTKLIVYYRSYLTKLQLYHDCRWIVSIYESCELITEHSTKLKTIQNATF